MINRSVPKRSDKNNEIRLKLKYTLKTHNYNTKATNVDKTGERGKVPIGRAIQAGVGESSPVYI